MTIQAAPGTPPVGNGSPTADEAETGADRLWQSPVSSDAAFLLARANALSLARLHDLLEPFGLRTRSYSLLVIAASDARPSQRELSDFLRLDPSQIVALVDQLEARELVRREADPRDRRAKVVVATDTGRDLAHRAREAVLASDQQWFTSLPEGERQRFFDMLQALAVAAPEA